MKYMGSKRAMLTNGLGVLLDQAIAGRTRFVDLFSGSGAVTRFVATTHEIPVVAVDLQRYAALLAGSVIHRTSPIATVDEWAEWNARARAVLMRQPDVLEFAEALQVTHDQNFTGKGYARNVELTRDACQVLLKEQSLGRAYGGYYFGLMQVLWLEALRQTVPNGNLQEVAIAALVEAASECTASPGHTAQPFAPTIGGMPHLIGAWSRDIVERTKRRFEELGAQHAKVRGTALVGDAVQRASDLKAADLVFVDPPYSEVQYSRFYHVLEGVACGFVEDAVGVGRYPPLACRPQSNFSRRLPAVQEFQKLIAGIAVSGAHALVTFPEAEASNGLSGTQVEEISSRHFSVARRVVKSTFSTLGGTGATRDARQGTTELILHLIPL